VAALLGVSWSPVAAELPDLDMLVDIVEAPGWGLEDALAESGVRRRVLLHNLDLDVSLADPAYIDSGWGERANAAIRRAGTPWFSLHLGFASERVRFDGHMLPESEPLGRDELLAQIVDSVRTAKTYLDLPLLLENLDYCPEGAYEHVCDPDFISEVLDATDTGLLLDIGHLMVTANWFETEPEALLARMPLDRLVEVHLSGPRPLQGNTERLDDVHDDVGEPEVRLLRLVLEQAQPKAVVLEYRRDADRLREQLAMLGAVIGRRWRGIAC
jgi:uncharacterized protein (UPF0276 family)